MLNKLGKLSLLFLFVFSIYSVSVLANEQHDVQFEVEFINTTFDPDKNESVWTYQVTGQGKGPDLSHWMLELCPDIEVIDASHAFELQNKPDPISGLVGIKFEQPVKVDEAVEYTIRIKGNWEQELITASVKGATDVNSFSVMGPGCTAVVEGSKEETDEDQGNEKSNNNDGSTKNTKDQDGKEESSEGVEEKPKVKVNRITLFKADVSSTRKVTIQAAVDLEEEVRGVWQFTLGGKAYSVEGGKEVILEVEDAPVGTYHVKAQMKLEDGDTIDAEEALTIHVPTEQGGTLPNTATHQYLILLIGVLSLMVGFYILKRKKGLV
ncbi:LPXTG cell wall anchor domain-containing protein [Ammoniphilus sp. CFH 90114]|uniref:LPXTG cell wall anchor domain-containing protein n=1 Tax=Ammoniphilus sp. CFH 90114 TaxID=2493665 RepID=UPI00100E4971|nr:LPXTG cell wall anchor domain-containing protein [Ammoniphilus sp. CFH 90114]RXT04355.1 LPXTG cell wall anchor domain-containing protein [Ammoniphilus sp. CFH 90114]